MARLVDKQCCKCDEVKSIDMFAKRKSNIDGYRYACKSCESAERLEYSRTKKGLITRMYNNQVMRSKRANRDIPTYSKSELREWLYSQELFHKLFDNWKRLDFQTDYVPSVDRVSDSFGYTISNIQLMTWQENNDKGNSDIVSGKSKGNSKAIVQINKKGEIMREFRSSVAASRELNISKQSISECCIDGVSRKGLQFKFRKDV